MRHLGFALVLLISSPAWGADLSKIDRTIKKEPAYAGKPRYCLLVLGDAHFKVWLVLDGKTLYVDRNGNGDLTEAGERITLGPESSSFEKVDLTNRRDQRTYRLSVHLWHPDKKNASDTVEQLVFVVSGKQSYAAYGDERAPLIFKARGEAPVVYIDGPLQMGFEAQTPVQKLTEGTYRLSAAVGTPGLGPGSFAHLEYNVIPENVHPRAILEFSSAKGAPIKRELVLKERC